MKIKTMIPIVEKITSGIISSMSFQVFLFLVGNKSNANFYTLHNGAFNRSSSVSILFSKFPSDSHKLSALYVTFLPRVILFQKKMHSGKTI